MDETGKATLREGNPIMLVDWKARSYFATLKAGGRTDIRGHQFAHDDILGRPEGFRLDSSRGKPFFILRPTLGEYVPKMPRHATVIYPKDLGTILVYADIFPGAKVLEAGIGSAGLSLALLRAIGPAGHLTSYEIRTEAINRGEKNIAAYLGEVENHTIKVADVYAGIDETGLDRIVLDVPEPWQVVPHAIHALRDGGGFCAYSPTTLQVQETVAALKKSHAFVRVETWESLQRGWHVAPMSVRPDLNMVGHTGFLTFARKVRGGPEPGTPVTAPRPGEGAWEDPKHPGKAAPGEGGSEATDGAGTDDGHDDPEETGWPTTT